VNPVTVGLRPGRWTIAGTGPIPARYRQRRKAFPVSLPAGPPRSGRLPRRAHAWIDRQEEQETGAILVRVWTE